MDSISIHPLIVLTFGLLVIISTQFIKTDKEGK